MELPPSPTNSGFADHAGMKLGMALNPEDVAQATLNALGKKPTILPGFISKLLTYSLVGRGYRLWGGNA